MVRWDAISLAAWLAFGVLVAAVPVWSVCLHVHGIDAASVLSRLGRPLAVAYLVSSAAATTDTSTGVELGFVGGSDLVMLLIVSGCAMLAHLPEELASGEAAGRGRAPWHRRHGAVQAGAGHQARG